MDSLAQKKISMLDRTLTTPNLSLFMCVQFHPMNQISSIEDDTILSILIQSQITEVIF